MLLTEQVFLLHHKRDKASRDFRERSLPTPTTLQSQRCHFLPVRQLLAPGSTLVLFPRVRTISHAPVLASASLTQPQPVTLAYGEVERPTTATYSSDFLEAGGQVQGASMVGFW